MNGYLMLERDWTPGEDLFLESFSPESQFGVVFEDDGEAAYFYAVEKDPNGAGLRILDALHIHERDGDDAPPAGPSRLQVLWAKDWKKCALLVDGYVHALFDFATHGGYNVNEFPPPNAIWTNGDRRLTEEQIRRSF
ncbi:MAG TPA: DUF2251 domain-containing protein [Puia sp.]|nr:DUF2251 domain-containing protein [Puia sp.]